jgi:hypothetical protein
LQLIERDKPPLTKGMFVSAYIQGFASPQFLVPDKALHGDRIYLMNAEQQLEIVEVQVLFRTADKVAIAGDIEEGAQLVLNDLIPAIAGMSLKPMNASDAPAAPVEQ